MRACRFLIIMIVQVDLGAPFKRLTKAGKKLRNLGAGWAGDR
jgi:hypothetical protein